VTRGTTGDRRLRRVDRWLVARHRPALTAPGTRVVDLGFGASPVTTLELAARLRNVNPEIEVIGVEIDPERVAAAIPHRRPGVDFVHGGFELAGLRPNVVRALNVLRQYDETDVSGAWSQLAAAVRVGGIVIEGTCDETGDLGAWVTVGSDGPRALTLALDLGRTPSAVAARLPKALIHRNVPGEPVHDLLVALDNRWQAHSALAVFGARQRFAATVADLRTAGWPVLDGPRQWRRGELTLAWHAIRPRAR
jgi:hypothetical protein